MQNEGVDWVAVFGEKMDCFDFFNDMAYNKYLILILCIVYCLWFACFYGKRLKSILLVGMVD